MYLSSVLETQFYHLQIYLALDCNVLQPHPFHCPLIFASTSFKLPAVILIDHTRRSVATREMHM